MLALEINDLKKTYRNGVQALKGIDLRVKQGEFIALLGPNGAGKSTFISILTSLVRKTAGHVEVFGFDIDKAPSSVKSCIGAVPQEFNFSIFEKVQNIIMNQAGYFGLSRSLAKERTEEYLKKLQLWDKRDSISRNLSGGMKRRLMIARAMVHRPKLLILDEPTAGVDIEIRRSMWEYLKQLHDHGTTIILTTHYLEEAEQLCDRIAIINNGHIIEDLDKKRLLAKLDRQSFVFDMQGQATLPVNFNTLFDIEKVDDLTLQVSISGKQNLTDVFEFFSSMGWKVKSMRNKTNRLEELFVSMTGQDIS
jgi:ABC-2 type transport system ATP-binding protein